MRKILERDNRTIVWENLKAGVIESNSGKIIVPIRFDELYERFYHNDNVQEGQPTITVIGYACFIDDGEAIAYDTNGNIDQWRDWEYPLMEQPELPNRSVESIEEEVRRRYYEEDATPADLQELLRDRYRILDRNWKHTPEYVAEICRINDMLNSAVKQALEMGEKLSKSLHGDWSLDINVYPEWEDDDFRNIIVELGRCPAIRDYSPCFTYYSHGNIEDHWDFKEATLDDGVSWDEGPFRRPAYQNCYFLHPFQELVSDNYQLSFSDIISIRNFNIRILIDQPADK